MLNGEPVWLDSDRIAVDIGNVCQELERFLAGGAIAESGWAFGAKSVNVS